MDLKDSLAFLVGLFSALWFGALSETIQHEWGSGLKDNFTLVIL
jgi:hypothetical protein